MDESSFLTEVVQFKSISISIEPEASFYSAGIQLYSRRKNKFPKASLPRHHSFRPIPPDNFAQFCFH